MATSDSPLSVPNVTLAVARGAASPPAAGQRVISGAGFGSGPNVVLFDRFNGEDGQVVPLDGPEIGAWDQHTGAEGVFAKYYLYNGRTWMKGRDPVTSTSISRAALRYLHGSEFQEFFWTYRTTIPSGFKMPGAANPGELSTADVKSNWKLAWLSTALGTNYAGGGGGAEIVVPTFVSNGFMVGGNTCSPSLINGSRYMDVMDLTQDNVVAWYQSGDESAEGADDATIEHLRVTSAGLERVISLGDPFAPLLYSEVDPVHPSYGAITFNAWMGNFAPNPASGVLPLMADAYLAVGPNSRSRIMTGNAATLAACTQVYTIPPDSWADNEVRYTPVSYEALTYTHIILADGTLIENAEGV